MDQRPTSFGQLLCRFAPPRSAATQNQSPLIGSATQTARNCAGECSPIWVILHSITDSDVCLIHSCPLAAGKLTVQIPMDGGEILRVTLAMAGSQKKSALYESTAQFLP